jgi:hypothetical protein
MMVLKGRKRPVSLGARPSHTKESALTTPSKCIDDNESGIERVWVRVDGSEEEAVQGKLEDDHQQADPCSGLLLCHPPEP